MSMLIRKVESESGPRTEGEMSSTVGRPAIKVLSTWANWVVHSLCIGSYLSLSPKTSPSWWKVSFSTWVGTRACNSLHFRVLIKLGPLWEKKCMWIWFFESIFMIISFSLFRWQIVWSAATVTLCLNFHEMLAIDVTLGLTQHPKKKKKLIICYVWPKVGSEFM